MPSFRAAPVRVRVPATSANLGPGFDTAALALALYDDVLVRVVDSGLVVDVAGEGAEEVPRDRRHLVVRALRETFARLGGQPRGLEVVCANRIPHSRGLGSSAAAICAGVLAARALVLGGVESVDADAALALAVELEGHPDNVAACLSGGFTLAFGSPVSVLRLPPHPDLVAVAFIPPTRSSTRKARALLPDAVAFSEAAATVARAALLPCAVTARPDLLLAATQDWLHQPHRASAQPRSARLMEALRADGVPAFVSGAGPTVLALVPRADAAALDGRAPRGWAQLTLEVDAGGGQTLPVS